ncbi:ribonuclease BN [Altererythrobacter aurantiacus]|uniref:Ribonuclease BN n=1 Tax=Parapontixanthobacter aurantiacus TaxID=1463599 RepID=A0A844ZGV7_9SPHN|nr:ribonuclease BN [Parapontixanthobacter aurantiacus]
MAETELSDPDKRQVRSLSPEERRKAAFHFRDRVASRMGPGTRFFEITKRVFVGTYNEGFIHAGNLAYMSMLAIFPFFILGAAVFSAIGEESERAATINTILIALPPTVRETIGPVARDVVQARSGWLLWAGAAVALWTVGSLIETIREMLRRAYGTEATYSFWKYRLFSTGIIIVAVVLLLLSLIAQLMITAAQQVIEAYLPTLNDVISGLALSRIVPGLGLFGSLYMIFYTLTPHFYRQKRYPKWPGALVVTLWWIGVTVLMPQVLSSFFSYDLTYGSLAGIMVTLFFFYLVGLGMVVGAELNAALAETPEEEQAAELAQNKAAEGSV